MSAPGAAARTALSAAQTLGPFFAVDTGAGPDWVTWARLVADAGVVQTRVAEVRALLGAGPGAPDVEVRVAASIVHLGLVARLLSPVLGAAVATGVLPVAPPERVHVHLVGANPVPLAFEEPSAVPAPTPHGVASGLAEHWLVPVVEPLGAAVGESSRLSGTVLAGNVASGVAGALRQVAAARCDLAPRADAVLDALLTGPLAGTGRRRRDGSFVRSSCCLFYRVPGAGTCGDCVLTDRGAEPGAV